MKQRVVIVGMGESRNDFLKGRLLRPTADELADADIWAINFMAAEIRCDKMIAMDPMDLEGLEKAYPPGHLDYLRKTQLPIVSCKKVDGFNIEEFPLEAVKERFKGFAYFTTSAAYAIGLAIHEGYREIWLYGFDFSYRNDPTREDGRACVEFWLGVAMTMGLQIRIAESSRLMEQDIGRPLYGYSHIKE